MFCLFLLYAVVWLLLIFLLIIFIFSRPSVSELGFATLRANSSRKGVLVVTSGIWLSIYLVAILVELKDACGLPFLLKNTMEVPSCR